MACYNERGGMPLGCERILPTSNEIQQRLDLARTELAERQQQLFESKSALIQKLRGAFPGFVDSAIRRLVENNATRIRQMSSEEVKKMKAEIEKEKPKAIENAFRAFDSSSDWLWCPSSATRSSADPIDIFGINQGGPIWKLLEGYSKPLEEIFSRYGLSVGVPVVSGLGINPLKPPYRFLEDLGLEEPNKAVGKAHEKFCSAKRNVDALERQLEEAQALEKFESA